MNPHLNENSKNIPIHKNITVKHLKESKNCVLRLINFDLPLNREFSLHAS